MANGLEGVSSFALADPDRIVIDLEGASAGVSSAAGAGGVAKVRIGQFSADVTRLVIDLRSEEHTSELQSLMRISYAVFCLKKKTNEESIVIYTQKQRNNKDKKPEKRKSN